MKQLFQKVDETRKAAVEQALLAAAERVLSKKGYESATMRDIAAEAGCSNGSLYLYFSTKEELVNSLVNMHMCQITSAMTERMRSTEDSVTKLRLGCNAMLEYFCEHQGFFRVFFSGISSRGGLEQSFTGEGREAYDTFRQYKISVIEQAQKEGRIRKDIPADELHDFIRDAAIAAMARWTATPKSEVISKRADSLWQFTSQGLGLSTGQG